MRKISLLVLGTLGVLGIALLALGAVRSTQSSAAPVTAVVTNDAPLLIAAAVEPSLNNSSEWATRDAVTGDGSELLMAAVSPSLADNEMAAIHRDDTVDLDTGTLLALVDVPAAVSPAVPAPAASLNSTSWRAQPRYFWHSIRWGETLSGIARRFGTTVWRLRVLNGSRNPDCIITGRSLLVPR